jgi:hypothetical protein
MKRCVLLIALFALLQPVRSQSIPLGEIVGDDRSIRDSLYGVSARYPNGWAVRGVTRWGDRETTIYFSAPSASGAIPTLYYRVFATPASRPAADEAYLRQIAERKAERRVIGGLGDYANVINSFAFKSIGGLPAMSYTARFTSNERTYAEYFVHVVGEKGVALLFLRAPVDEIDELRPAMDSLAETIRLQ